MTNEMMFPILNRNVMPTAGKLIARPTRRPFSGHNATVAARGPFGQQWPRQMEGPGKNSRAGQMTMKILRIADTTCSPNYHSQLVKSVKLSLFILFLVGENATK